ncbi:phosphocarrier protein HPr [Ectothiorhodospira haloalkaliphila]|uniref:Phosphocarrier protein HPr n=1 Tax=Ectothiorhodospira haloalkaliphila TaxID=421628 RepID=W8KMJ4_9GAMM|nr:MULTISPECIES: HPr family phosphocarrier protein [Ectothiorhodospira]AHK78217.1 phosphocarrier protein HPr [Ectothiorhodospira haloalkaliphila]MCG5493443.1 HPr family phosphocarrier protein [Ectothiorhodospira variabilis]MCG5496789.1 HPr family phosphocarrier protein [Ectothiorhodospira variabilis]MCG5502772.1 HPr family phosphocarrier protein [Ectothiorhodospira variabilis]MCG5505462.1 HPr family phosphocarrier protein [Ectothiorhodospira variabilis]
MPTREVEIINKLGMHARAAAKFVNLASSYAADLEVEKGSRRVNGKSIMGIMMLAASRGTTVRLIAEGEDAEQALEALEGLIGERFGEPE